MTRVSQLSPEELFQNKENLENFLCERLSHLINEKTWMKDWKQIAQRFRLFKFKDLSKEEAYSYHWNKEKVEKIIVETIQVVKKHLPYDEITITVFPALPFPWFQKYDQSIWTNGFTNGSNNILIAVPPYPDEEFIRYMIAHELHHATPINPIYNLTLDNFSLYEWLKMEGGAEFFSLSIYGDKRWWKDDFTSDVDKYYWSEIQNKLDTTDDKEKGKLCFGDPNNGIPYFAGYAFAYKLFKNFTNTFPTKNFVELLQIEPKEYIDTYMKMSLNNNIN